MKRLTALVLAALVALVAPAAGALEVGDPIPDRYIVVLKDDGTKTRRGLGVPVLDDVAGLATGLLERHGGELLYAFGPALPGYLAQLTPEQAERLARDERVKRVEQDRVVAKRERPASWGLDRVDQRALPLDSEFSPPGNAGAGVNVYVIDTGLRGSHRDFQGRVGGGANFAGAGPGPGLIQAILSLLHPGNVDRDDWADCNGHGTHVASTAVGAQHGVARGATIYGVRVLGCDGSGTNSGVIAGIDWVLENHSKPAVANLSLGGGASSSLDEAMRRLVQSGVTAVVAAGNDDADACKGSPNRVAEAITVGATDRQDQRAGFSNWGRCVNIFAPGHEIRAAWYQSDSQTQTISGTSMASPHVAGAAALVLGAQPDLAPAGVAGKLQEAATTGTLSGLRSGSPNRLLYLSAPASDGETPADPEEAAPTEKKKRGLRDLLPF